METAESADASIAKLNNTVFYENSKINVYRAKIPTITFKDNSEGIDYQEEEKK